MDDKNSTRRPVKVGGYSHSVLDAKKEARRAEAEQRADRYRGLSLKEKLQNCGIRRGNSKREVARLGGK